MPDLVYVALGGNIGDTEQVFKSALIELKKLGTEFKVSSFYRTKPVSDIPQPDYLNAVCSFKTDLNPRAVLERLQKIEKELGKSPKPRNAPRIIDLDLLFFGDKNIQEVDLIVPHPRFHERLFVLEPLKELTDRIGKWDIQLLVQELYENH